MSLRSLSEFYSIVIILKYIVRKNRMKKKCRKQRNNVSDRHFGVDKNLRHLIINENIHRKCWWLDIRNENQCFLMVSLKLAIQMQIIGSNSDIKKRLYEYIMCYCSNNFHII